jgi:hypothetical protein
MAMTATTEPWADSEAAEHARLALSHYAAARADNNLPRCRDAIWAALYHLTAAAGALDAQISPPGPMIPAEHRRRASDRLVADSGED